MNNQEIIKLIRESWTALMPHYESEIECIIEESDLESRIWGILLSVKNFEPDHTTPAHLLVRVPYTAAELYLAQLYEATQAGYLEEVNTGKFRLSSRGRSELNRFITDARDAMLKADPLSRDDSLKLADLLDKLVINCLETDPPPDTWSIRLSHKLMPSKDQRMPYIEQQFSCLAAFRDDAHLAAWQQSGLSATALETLTYLWRDQANSITSLTRLLAHRGHSLWVYADALAVLREYGYVAGDDDVLIVTPLGREFRSQVEEDTDRFFYAPWICLTDPEKSELTQLLIKLRNGLKNSAKQI
jgi:hypothetical protein